MKGHCCCWRLPGNLVANTRSKVRCVMHGVQIVSTALLCPGKKTMPERMQRKRYMGIQVTWLHIGGCWNKGGTEFWKEVWNPKRASDPLKRSLVSPSPSCSLSPEKQVFLPFFAGRSRSTLTLLEQREKSPVRGERNLGSLSPWCLPVFKSELSDIVFKASLDRVVSNLV